MSESAGARRRVPRRRREKREREIQRRHASTRSSAPRAHTSLLVIPAPPALGDTRLGAGTKAGSDKNPLVLLGPFFLITRFIFGALLAPLPLCSLLWRLYHAQKNMMRFLAWAARLL